VIPVRKFPRWLFYSFSILPPAAFAFVWFILIDADRRSSDMKGLGVVLGLAATILFLVPLSLFVGFSAIGVTAMARNRGEKVTGPLLATILAFSPCLYCLGFLLWLMMTGK